MSYCNYIFTEKECELIEDFFPNYHLVTRDHIEMYVNGNNKKNFKIRCDEMCRSLQEYNTRNAQEKIDFYISEYECKIAAFPPRGGNNYVNVWAHFVKVKKEDAQ